MESVSGAQTLSVALNSPTSLTRSPIYAVMFPMRELQGQGMKAEEPVFVGACWQLFFFYMNHALKVENAVSEIFCLYWLLPTCPCFQMTYGIKASPPALVSNLGSLIFRVIGILRPF